MQSEQVPDHGVPLEPNAADMRVMGHAAVEALAGFIDGLRDRHAYTPEGAHPMLMRLRGALPTTGRAFENVLREVMETVDYGITTPGPGFLGYIPGGGLYSSAIAALLGFGLNQYVTVWDASPGGAQIEETVVRWMCDLFEYPPGAEGILTSGGSMANFSAIVTARRALLPDDFLHGIIYTSDQAHHSVAKAAMLAGFPRRNVRAITTDTNLRIDIDVLSHAIDADRRAGRVPFCIVANAGTTNTGTIDDLRELTQIAHIRRMWLHADAAYGGFFWITERGRHALRGLTGADSITLDPHKGLFLPFGVGALVVRDGARLRDAHRLWGDYMQDRHDDSDETRNFTDYSPELSRDFRGLRVWLPLQLHGLDAFRSALDEKLDLAAEVHEALTADGRFELPWTPDLSVVAFRLRGDGEDADRRNFALLERINASGRVFLSSTRLGGRVYLRIAILSHRTHADRIREAIALVRTAAGGI